MEQHGLQHCLSSDHLEAILEEASLGSVSQLLAITNADSKPQDSVDDLLAIANASSGNATENPNLDLTPSEIKNIIDNQPKVVISPLSKPNDNLEHVDNQATMPKIAKEVDAENIIEGKRSRFTHNSVLLEAQTEALVHLAKEIPIQDALSGKDKDNFKDAWLKEVNSILKHTAVPVHPDDPDFQIAIAEATSSRFIANKKRDGRCKFRWVVQGCFEPFDMDDWTNYVHDQTLFVQ